MSNKVFTIVLLAILAAGVAGDKYFTAAAKRKTVSARTYPKPSYVRYETKLNEEQVMFLARQQARQTEPGERCPVAARARPSRPAAP